MLGRGASIRATVCVSEYRGRLNSCSLTEGALFAGIEELLGGSGAGEKLLC